LQLVRTAQKAQMYVCRSERSISHAHAHTVIVVVVVVVVVGGAGGGGGGVAYLRRTSWGQTACSSALRCLNTVSFKTQVPKRRRKTPKRKHKTLKRKFWAPKVPQPLAEELSVHAVRTGKLVDPLDLAHSVHPVDVQGHVIRTLPFWVTTVCC
jgi:hypothetical protein